MIKLNVENSSAIISAAQEIMDTTGQLWVTLGDDTYYIPELIQQLQTLAEQDNKTTQFI